MWKSFLTILITAVIAGGGVFLWQNQTVEEVEEVVAPNCDEEVQALEDELLKVETEYMLEVRGRGDAPFIQDPDNPNDFYYIVNGSGESWVEVYNAETEEEEVIYRDTEIEENMEFWGLDVIDGKFYFYYTAIDNSPGPCYSLWVNKDAFTCVDISTGELETCDTPEEKRSEAETWKAECEESLGL